MEDKMYCLKAKSVSCIWR